jgi:hypothetical protein
VHVDCRTRSSSRRQAPRWAHPPTWRPKSSPPRAAAPMTARWGEAAARLHACMLACVRACIHFSPNTPACTDHCVQGLHTRLQVLLLTGGVCHPCAGGGCVVLRRHALRHAVRAVPLWAARGHQPEDRAPDARHAAGPRRFSCIFPFEPLLGEICTIMSWECSSKICCCLIWQQLHGVVYYTVS